VCGLGVAAAELRLCFVIKGNAWWKRTYPPTATILAFHHQHMKLLSDYGTNKQSNIVEHINWVLSELSVRVHKTVNRIGRTCISLLSRTHRFLCIL